MIYNDAIPNSQNIRFSSLYLQCDTIVDRKTDLSVSELFGGRDYDAISVFSRDSQLTSWRRDRGGNGTVVSLTQPRKQVKNTIIL